MSKLTMAAPANMVEMNFSLPFLIQIGISHKDNDLDKNFKLHVPLKAQSLQFEYPLSII